MGLVNAQWLCQLSSARLVLTVVASYPSELQTAPHLWHETALPTRCNSLSLASNDNKPESQRAREPGRPAQLDWQCSCTSLHHALAAASISSTVTCLTLAAPTASPAATSAAFNCSHADQSTTLTPRCCNTACSAARPGAAQLKAASSWVMLCTVSSASVRLVPMMPVGPRLSQPQTYRPGTTSARPTPVHKMARW